jgi:hypothetical protein
LISKITLISHQNISGTRVKPLGLVGFDFGPPSRDIYGMPAHADWSRMSRKFSLSIAIFLSLLPAVAFAAPYLGKRHAFHWHGYGFLPGYHQPPDNSVPIYTAKRSSHSVPAYTPSYWYNGGHYYFGDPGFFRSRYNGGSFGPCWTWTPIGLMWNCG